MNHFVIFIFAFTILNALSVFAGPSRTTYQAKIIKPDGYPLEATSVNFKFTILDPAGSCILYSETFSTVNMGSSAGLVSFSLGTGVRTFPVVGSTFEQVFSNTTASLTCDAGGPATYSPSANDTRKIVMQFNDGNGWQTLPAMTINAVPYAMYANDSLKFSGKDITDFVQVASLPTCGASEAMRFNGVGFSCIATGGTVTSGSVITALGYTPADGASITTVTANLNSVSSTVASVSSTVYSVASSVASLQNSVAASFTAITSSQWISSGSAISYDSGFVGVGTSAPTGRLHVVGTGGGNLFKIEDQVNGPSGAYLELIHSRAGASLANNDFTGGIYFRGMNSGGLQTMDVANIFSQMTNVTSGSESGNLAFYTRDNGARTEKMRIIASGNIGVGTTNPVTKLDVSGAIRIGMESASCAASYAGAIRYNAGAVEFCNGTAWAAIDTGSVTSAAVTSALGYTPMASGSASYLVADGGSTASPTVRFAPDASTGFYRFGTNSIGVSVNNNFLARFDSAGLQVQGNISAGNQCSYKICIGMWSAPGLPTPALTDLGQVIGINRNGPGTTVLGNGLYVTAGGAPTGASNMVGGDLILGSGISTGNATSNIELRTATAGASGTADSTPTVKMKILGNGNVGIGTTNPLRSLAILGANGLSGTLKSQIDITDTTAYNLTPAAGIQFSGQYMSNGTVAALGGIAVAKENTTSGDRSAYFAIYTASGGSAPGERLRVASDGDVGIGTTAPGAKLEVAGQVKITGGAPGAGKILTSDSTGLATWETPGSSLPADSSVLYKVRAATTANITLSAPQTVDGIALSAGDRVLVKNQTTASQNGVYVVSGGAWSRSTDFDSWSESNNYEANVSEGTSWGGAKFAAKTPVTGTLGTTSIYFSPIGSTADLARSTAMGAYALSDLTTGQNSTAVGNYALRNNTTGSANTAVGAMALEGNTTANENTAIGVEALRSSNGTGNTAVGYNSLYGNSGSNNIGIGHYALRYPSGSNNIGIGKNIMGNSPSGSDNIGMGYQALKDVTSGYTNVAIGSSALNLTTTGYQNTALSQSALQSNTTGNRNVGLGVNALLLNTTGSNNIALGYNAGSAITTGSNNVVIGANTGSTIAASSNNILISDGAGNIRLQADSTGLVTVSGTLKVTGGTPGVGKVLTSDADGDATWETPSGGNFKSDGSVSMTGTFKAADGTDAAPGITWASDPDTGFFRSSGTVYGFAIDGTWRYVMTPTRFGHSGGGASIFSTNTAAAPGFAGSSDTDTGMFITGPDAIGFSTAGTEKVRISSAGNFGIGTSSPAAKLDVSGTIKISGGSPGVGKVLTSDADGDATWATVAGDNLGNHTATQNLNLGTYKLVGQGGSEGITIDSTGNIRLGSVGGSTQITAGPGSTASGSSWASIAAGFNAQASSITTFAFGSYAKATNWYAFATGNRTTAGGRASAVFGQNIDVNSDYSVGFGLSSSVSYTVNTPSTMAIMGGKVGIGTTTPSVLLTVDDSVGTVSSPYIASTDKLVVMSSGNGVIQMTTPASNTGAIYFSDPQSRDPGGVAYSHLTDSLIFRANQGNRMTIASGGAVGIGTTSPSSYQHGGTNQTAEIYNSGTAANSQAHIVLSSGNSTNADSSIGTITFAQPNMSDANKGLALMSGTTDTDYTTSAPTSRLNFWTRGAAETNWSTKMVIKGNGNVGIGTTNPGAKLDVAGDGYALFGPNSGWGATLRVGGNGGTATAQASIATTNGNLHLDALDNSHNTYMNWYRGGDFSVGKGDASTALFVVKNSGNVGIGTAGPTALFHVNGAALATAWNTSSDKRLKENIKPIENPVDKILQLRGVEFDWRKDVTAPTKHDETHDIGVIAQEVEKVFPEAVTTPTTGYKSVAYSKLVAPLIEAVKSLYHRMIGLEAQQAEQVRAIASKADQQALDMANAKIQKLESENAAKDKEIQDMKLRLEKIEKALNSE